MIVYRMAIEKDLNCIAKVFKDATLNMYKKGIFQWDKTYPSREILREDIKKEQMFIGLFEGEIVCAYVLNRECNNGYENGIWEYSHSSYSVIHRLCVAPKYQNMGIGSHTLKHIERQLKRLGIECVRLDCFISNPYARRMYEKNGYSIVGHTDFSTRRFLLMEKRL